VGRTLIFGFSAAGCAAGFGSSADFVCSSGFDGGAAAAAAAGFCGSTAFDGAEAAAAAAVFCGGGGGALTATAGGAGDILTVGGAGPTAGLTLTGADGTGFAGTGAVGTGFVAIGVDVTDLTATVGSGAFSFIAGLFGFGPRMNFVRSVLATIRGVLNAAGVG